jgi:SAM-dependent methyltransferase
MSVDVDGQENRIDGYAAFAPVYDEWQNLYGAFWKGVLPRLESVFAGLPPEDPASPGSFIDLGCGTGGLLLALRASHPRWRLCGLDASRAMLDVARRKANAASIEWVNGTFDGAFEAGGPVGQFRAAGAFFDALNHAAAPGALARSFAATAARLEPGGLFVFDLNNRLGYEAWWQDRRIFTGPGWTVTIDPSFDPVSGLARGRACIDRRHPPGGRGITDVTERCFSDEEIKQALAAAGFSVELFEAWAPEPADVPGKIWCVARRT